jgi:hypothetical protein
MAEILSYDPAGDPEVVGAMEADQAESLAIGEEMINQANARLAGKYKDAQELEKAYIELEKKLGSRDGEGEAPEPQAEEQQQEPSEYSSQIEAISKAAEEFNSKGELSAETLAEFEKMSLRNSSKHTLSMSRVFLQWMHLKVLSLLNLTSTPFKTL